jgi:hypothetical protein
MVHLLAFGRQEITQEWGFQFQIGTKTNRPLDRATIGFRQKQNLINRTLLF